MDAKPIYVAGPVSYGGAIAPHIVGRNLQALKGAAIALRELGHEVICPAEFDAPDGKTWSDYMREGIAAVCASRMVVVLPGWECSQGAVAEVGVAHTLGIPVVPLDVVSSS